MVFVPNEWMKGGSSRKEGTWLNKGEGCLEKIDAGTEVGRELVKVGEGRIPCIGVKET